MPQYDDELKIIGQEAVIAYFKALFWHSRITAEASLTHKTIWCSSTAEVDSRSLLNNLASQSYFKRAYF
jgi:hypothetical protein